MKLARGFGTFVFLYSHHFWKLQLASPNGNVLCRCSAFAPVGHRSSPMIKKENPILFARDKEVSASAGSHFSASSPPADRGSQSFWNPVENGCWAEITCIRVLENFKLMCKYIQYIYIY